jgi:hypothetical protein
MSRSAVLNGRVLNRATQAVSSCCTDRGDRHPSFVVADRSKRGLCITLADGATAGMGVQMFRCSRSAGACKSKDS